MSVYAEQKFLPKEPRFQAVRAMWSITIIKIVNENIKEQLLSVFFFILCVAITITKYSLVSPNYVLNLYGRRKLKWV
jgi:hypothetical protein